MTQGKRKGFQREKKENAHRHTHPSLGNLHPSRESASPLLPAPLSSLPIPPKPPSCLTLCSMGNLFRVNQFSVAEGFSSFLFSLSSDSNNHCILLKEMVFVPLLKKYKAFPLAIPLNSHSHPVPNRDRNSVSISILWMTEYHGSEGTHPEPQTRTQEKRGQPAFWCLDLCLLAQGSDEPSIPLLRPLCQPGCVMFPTLPVSLSVTFFQNDSQTHVNSKFLVNSKLLVSNYFLDISIWIFVLPWHRTDHVTH